MRVRIDEVLQAFDASLELVEDERQRAQMARVLQASRDSVQRAVLDLLRQVADEVNESAGEVFVQIVYDREGAEVVVSRPSPEEVPDEGFEIDFDADEIDRLTLRLPAELKEIAAAAAEQAGVSLNSWLTRLVTREAAQRARRGEERRRRRGPGQSLKGWIGS